MLLASTHLPCLCAVSLFFKLFYYFFCGWLGHLAVPASGNCDALRLPSPSLYCLRCGGVGGFSRSASAPRLFRVRTHMRPHHVTHHLAVLTWGSLPYGATAWSVRLAGGGYAPYTGPAVWRWGLILCTPEGASTIAPAFETVHISIHFNFFPCSSLIFFTSVVYVWTMRGMVKLCYSFFPCFSLWF